MKLYKLITFGLALSAMVLSSCRDNDYPTFNDADAFVAMQSAAYVVGEKDNSIEIPVMLTSLSGLEKTVEFTITPDSVAGAVEGTHFTLENESKSLTFTKDQPTQTIKLKIIDNNSYDGNVKFNISLAKTEGLNLGANSNCVVTIRDDEHPLAAFLGTYSASADSYFASRGHFDWEITISTDESDDNKVWIANIDPFFGKYGYVAPNYNFFYGFANEEKTEIHIPVGQEHGYKDSDGNMATLEGFTFGLPVDDDECGVLDTGDYITLTLLDGGKQLRFENGYGIYCAGWYNIMDVGLVINKK